MRDINDQEYATGVEHFHELCKKMPTPIEPTNRFICVEQLQNTISAKKGAYSNENRRDWFRILYTCLAAPDCYFTGYPIQGDKKRVSKFEKKLRRLQEHLKLEKRYDSSIVTYFDCVRECMESTDSYLLSEKVDHPLAQQLIRRLSKALEHRKKKFSVLQNIDYKKELDYFFLTHQKLLDQPAVLCFMPYLVFFQLAKCEQKIGKNISATSVPNINKDDFSWNIRNSPFESNGQKNIDQLVSLYDLVESAIIKAIHKTETALSDEDAKENTEKKDPNPVFLPHFSEIGELLGNELGTDYNWAESLSSLFVPLWDYGVWVTHFCRVFSVKNETFSKDLFRLFSLTFRTPSPKNKASQKSILEKYADKTMRSRENIFILSDLMTALCTIYNLRCFCTKEPFKETDLQNAINQLTNFLAATKQIRSYINDSAGIRWLTLISYGSGIPTEYSGDNPRCYFVNPSKVIMHKCLMRFIAIEADGYYLKKPRYFEALYPRQYDFVIHTIRKRIQHSICSTKEILRDIAMWGNIEIYETDDFNLADAIQMWNFWHKGDSELYQDLKKQISKHPEKLVGLTVSYKKPDWNPVKLHLDDDGVFMRITLSKKKNKLEEQKKLVLDYLAETFSVIPCQLEDLSDFRYVQLLFIIFRALREHMCHQIYASCLKFLPLTFFHI